MTPEQIDDWKKAINPLDYLDFHALGRTGLQTSTARLASCGVPDWAAGLRRETIAGGWEQRENWVLSFALYSDVALTGLSILYPDKYSAGPIYRRVRLRFLHKALEPFVEYIEELEKPEKSVRLIGYIPLLSLYQVTAFADVSPDGGAIQKVLDDANERKDLLGCYYNVDGLEEGESAVELAIELAGYWPRKPDVGRVCALLNRQHQWRLSERPTGEWYDWYDISDHFGFIASAYLTALEAECPPPDWIAEAIQ